MVTAAGPAFVAILGDDVDRLLRAEPDVRADIPDSVHTMRVATRRLRSVLRSYRTLLDRAQVRRIRDELRWLAGLLGAARDAEVRGDRFAALLEEYQVARPGDLTTAQRRTVRRLVSNERARYTAAHRVVLGELDDIRYTRLRTALLDLRRDPPLDARHADSDATRIFAKVLRNDFHRLHHLVADEATAREDPAVGEPEHIEQLHDIRKSAKRLRYCSEAAAHVLGDPASELAERAKKIQSVLGDHRDAIEAMAAIHTAAARTRAADTTAFDYLYASEADAARKALEQYPAATEFVRHHDHR